MAEHMAENQENSEAHRLLGQEYLTFSLGEEHYAVDILKVQEIRGYGAVTKIANAPTFIKGVINLRGVIVPIIDLRIKFNLGEAHYDEFTIVIVLNLADRVVGMVVDAVSDVVSLAGDDIKNPPDFSANFDSEYIMGLATVDDQMLIIADIERLMSSEEMALVDKTRSQAE